MRPTRLVRFVLSLSALALVGGACHTGTVYLDPTGPRWAGAVPQPRTGRPGPDTLLVVSFNVEYALEVDSAVAVLTTPPAADADIVLLQEMDEFAAARIASALGMGYVYYPAIHRKATGRNFGNAVLSRWPFEDDAKVLLPGRAIFGRTQRIATRASIRVDRRLIQVYSVHLATPPNMALRDRTTQMRTVLDDARRHPRVIVGGDLNSHQLGHLAEDRGYLWPTKEGPRTLMFGRWDHLFLKGMDLAGPHATGTVMDNKGASDHLPVWARIVVR